MCASRWTQTTRQGVLFRFGPLHLGDLAVTLGAGLVVLVLLEVLKLLWRKRLARETPSASPVP